MNIVYFLIIMLGNGGTQTQVFYSDIACQQAAAYIINGGGSAECVEDSRWTE